MWKGVLLFKFRDRASLEFISFASLASRFLKEHLGRGAKAPLEVVTAPGSLLAVHRFIKADPQLWGHFEHFEILSISSFQPNSPFCAGCWPWAVASQGILVLLCFSPAQEIAFPSRIAAPRVLQSPALLLGVCSPWWVKSQLSCLCGIHEECNHLWQI